MRLLLLGVPKNRRDEKIISQAYKSYMKKLSYTCKVYWNNNNNIIIKILAMFFMHSHQQQQQYLENYDFKFECILTNST